MIHIIYMAAGNSRRSVEVSKGLKRVYEQIAKRRGIAFLAASDVALPGEKDQEHMTREGHAALAEAVFEIRLPQSHWL